MESNSSDAHTHVEPDPSSVMPSSQPAPLNIRWGRTILALLGALALVTAVVSGVVALFVAAALPLLLTALGVVVAVVAGLRTLAVRDLNRRRASREAARTTAAAAIVAPVATVVVPRETTLFDRTEGTVEPVAAESAPLTAEELRNAALRVAAQGTADAKLAHTQTLAPGELDGESWLPVEVPVPGYVTAARAYATTTPLAIPAVPQSEGTSIKADQAGVSEPTGAPVVLEGGQAADAVDTDATDTTVAAKTAKANYALNNLDDVLQRRRA